MARQYKKRKSKYDPKYIDIIEKLAKAGWTQVDICKELGDIDEKTLQQWFRENPLFRLAWEKGRNECVQFVEGQLYRICSPHVLTTTIKDKNGNVIQTIEKQVDPSSHTLSLYLRAKDIRYREALSNVSNNVAISSVESSIPLILDEDKDL